MFIGSRNLGFRDLGIRGWSLRLRDLGFRLGFRGFRISGLGVGV